MSSETSTDVRHDHRSDALQPWQLFTLAGLVGATIVVFLARGESPAGIVLLSCAVFAAAFVGLTVLRTFLPLTGAIPQDLPEILGGRTRAGLEREKHLVLRAIKELEFDRGMGKVSDRDFTEMSNRLRARAGRLIRQLDAASVYRDQIERELEQRLGSARAASQPRVPAVERPAAGPDVGVCRTCTTRNDPDARFCKSCGARLEAAP